MGKKPSGDQIMVLLFLKQKNHQSFILGGEKTQAALDASLTSFSAREQVEREQENAKAAKAASLGECSLSSNCH